LRERLTTPQRAAYARELTILKSRAEGLLAEIPRKDKMTKIIRSIEFTLKDIAAVT